MLDTARKGFWVALGTLFVALGIIGIPLPLLPTTPFLLAAAACYLRGSERMHRWLLTHRWLGPYVRNYLEGRGIPLRTKALAIALLWLTITTSALFFLHHWALRLILFIIAIGVTTHLLLMKTLRE
ncbi:MAG TPA: DUF454 domain-containing protein [Thermoplasmatales archaeon]|nr:YbaN family protein [Candidatus Thermoplasmatota archaeon]HDS59022.1 DUF454 domain-containing protein [Thermoplasmatales archaeon]